MGIIKNHSAVWNCTDGRELAKASLSPDKKRPDPDDRDGRNQFEFEFLVYKFSTFFARYNQALYDAKLHPHDPTYAAKVATVVEHYREFARVPFVPNEYDSRKMGSVITLVDLKVVPTFDSDGLITGFLVEGISQAGPGTPDNYSSSSSSHKM